jgi:hypothetical protein
MFLSSRKLLKSVLYSPEHLSRARVSIAWNKDGVYTSWLDVSSDKYLLVEVITIAKLCSQLIAF